MRVSEGIWTLRVKGTFTIKTDGNSRCGLKPAGWNSFEYEVEIVATRVRPNHFVLDNRDCTTYFDTLRNDEAKGQLSCELLARQAARHFYNLIQHGRKDKVCKKASVRIWGARHASVEYTMPVPKEHT